MVQQMHKVKIKLNMYFLSSLNFILYKERITVRFLESLVRLSEAHAKLLYRDYATKFDAISVIILMECCKFFL
jgi:DNA recombination-dependent growth factor C